jgi:hypothetical protein
MGKGGNSRAARKRGNHRDQRKRKERLSVELGGIYKARRAGKEMLRRERKVDWRDQKNDTDAQRQK